MNSVISILVGILMFSVIIVIHEGGHFYAARFCGIPVKEFAIGMGPVIFKKQGKQTLFTVRAFPVGGFCAMDEDEEAVDENSFRSKPVWKRMIVIVAGAFMNLVLGFVIAVIFHLVSGIGITSTIAAFSDNSASQKAGLMINDDIVKINGMRVFSSGDIIYALRSDEDGVIDFVVRRNGQLIAINDVRFEMEMSEQTQKPVLKYDFKVYSEKITAANLIPYGFKTAAYDARIVILSLRDLIRGKYGINDLSGPVGIVTVISEAATPEGIDWDFILELAALISINIGIFNLLPLPALDGGRFVFLLIELFRKKQLKAETEGMIHFVGLALLLILMVAVTFNDIKNLAKRSDADERASVRICRTYETGGISYAQSTAR
ncbi:MAG: site-2 protease family protein [Oscillospiraceae bacterium]|nr:site-2 protease family protein [Oscillospiraceae bacterium]